MTTPPAHIREATAADIPRLVELMSQLTEDPSREDYAAGRAEYERAFAEIDADPRQRLLVLERDGDRNGGIIATAVLIIVPNLSHVGRPYATIENVVVDAAERGKRYGEQLMAHLVEEARKHKCYKAALTSNKGRADAHRFYTRIGFTATHEGFRIEM